MAQGRDQHTETDHATASVAIARIWHRVQRGVERIGAVRFLMSYTWLSIIDIAQLTDHW